MTSNRPSQAFSPSFWKAGLLAFFFILAYTVTISVLDANELEAAGLGALFAASAAFAYLTWFKRTTEASGSRLRQEVDEAEQALHRLEMQHSQAQAILESMMEGVCALDAEGRILWVNRSAEALFALDPKEAKGKRLVELVRQPDIEGLIAESLQNRKPAVKEIELLSPAEQSVRFQVIPCEGRAAAATVIVAEDVTEIRKLERMRREFVANVSHELKTPLTSIKGLVETLLNGALEDASNNRRFVSLIDEDATRLTRLIEDLLELSQIESKAQPLQFQPVFLRALFEDLSARFRHQCEAAQVVLTLQVPENLPSVEADPDRLKQIFVNLIDNAIKFNKPGGQVTVNAAAIPKGVAISIVDTGLGIPENDLPRVFERFYRVDKARSRELGGTGLGLSIVKHLVELQRGRIDVKSRLGQGTTFTVTLPVSPA